MFTTILAAVAAAFLEIAGCFAFWGWLRLDKPLWWTLPGIVALITFAVLLTRMDVAHAGRAFAAYGGIYIVCSLVWLSLVEDVRPDRWDLSGALFCLIGAGIMLAGPRSAI